MYGSSSFSYRVDFDDIRMVQFGGDFHFRLEPFGEFLRVVRMKQFDRLGTSRSEYRFSLWRIPAGADNRHDLPEPSGVLDLRPGRLCPGKPSRIERVI